MVFRDLQATAAATFDGGHGAAINDGLPAEPGIGA
jgi:hypothetical protein